MKSYEVVYLDDVSTPRAKRYVAWVTLNRAFHKEDIRDIIVDATDDVRERHDYRNQQNEERYGDKPAQVVWLYIANTRDDAEKSKWICRTQWIDDALETKPLPLDGSDDVEGIIVRWE